MTVFQAVLFGIVQGLTEFLPISSSAHLRILPELLGMEDPGSAFTAVIQLGTIAAVLIYFAKDIGKAFKAWAQSLTGKGGNTAEARMGWAVFVGSIPIIIVAVLAKDFIRSDSVRSLYVVSTMLIAFGLIMLAAEKLGTKKRGMETVKPKDGLIVGLWQVLALVPGVSRSGSTISGAYFAGFDRATAARFSFLLSVPSVTAAGLFELVSERKNILGPNLTAIIVATIVSFIVGYAAIAWLIKYIQKHGIAVFVIYRIALGIALIAMLQTGVIGATKQAPVATVTEESAIVMPKPPEGAVSEEHREAWAKAMKDRVPVDESKSAAQGQD